MHTQSTQAWLGRSLCSCPASPLSLPSLQPKHQTRPRSPMCGTGREVCAIYRGGCGSIRACESNPWLSKGSGRASPSRWPLGTAGRTDTLFSSHSVCALLALAALTSLTFARSGQVDFCRCWAFKRYIVPGTTPRDHVGFSARGGPTPRCGRDGLDPLRRSPTHAIFS